LYKWNIKAIPIVLVFDAKGTLVKKFDKDEPDNQFTYEDVEKLVVELLSRQKPTASWAADPATRLRIRARIGRVNPRRLGPVESLALARRAGQVRVDRRAGRRYPITRAVPAAISRYAAQ
jgi:hypothetical protein